MSDAPSYADVRAKVLRRKLLSLGCTVIQMLILLPALDFAHRKPAQIVITDDLKWLMGLSLLILILSIWVDRAVCVCPICKQYIGSTKRYGYYSPNYCHYACGTVSLFDLFKK